MKAKNVFIATLPRSGSTLAGMILGAHSQICHIGESAYWAKLDSISSKCCCGSIGCEFLIGISNIISDFPVEIENIGTACGIIDVMEEPNKIRHALSHSAATADQDAFKVVLSRCCAGIERVADAARVVFAKGIIVENSKYISIAEELLKKTGEWKILVLTRDPRGIALCNKMAGARKRVLRPVQGKIDLFVSFARRATELIRQENVLHVRYEDLCRNAFETIERMCEFLEVSFEREMLSFKKNKGHLLMGNHMMHDSNEVIREDLDWCYELSRGEKILFTREDIRLTYKKIGYDLEKGV